MTMGRGSLEPRMAIVYAPIPKKAAEPIEIYLVYPENILQLSARAMYMRIAITREVI